MRANERTDKRIELATWKFQIDQQDFGEGHGWTQADHPRDGWLEVPAYKAWDTYEFALRNYEGIGWYCTHFSSFDLDTCQHVLEFDGMGGGCTVWVNGILCATNDSRYLPFRVDVQHCLHPGVNHIAVKVNNAFQGKDHLPGGHRIEWVLYGGLTHHARVVATPKHAFSEILVQAAADGTVSGSVTVCNHLEKPFSGTLQVRVEDALFSQAFECPGGGTVTVPVQFCVPGITCWSPDHPQLYDCRIALQEDQSDYVVKRRIGFRTVEVRGTDILLNGKPIFLKGANRYDEYEPYGICPPPELIREDLLHMKRCGMNLVRTHYPQDPVHYRIADEIGILYMIEVPLNWWFPTAEEPFEAFQGLAAQAVDSLDRMYRDFCHHPSWAIWSMSNECAHEVPAGEAMFRMLTERARGYGSGRLITNVTCREITTPTELDYCDFIAVNTYPGACHDVLDELPGIAYEGALGRMQGVQELYPDKPLVMTEFGGNSVRGLRGDGGRLTEEQHARVLEEVCRGFLQVEHVRGLVIWSWADYFHHRLFVPANPGMHIAGPFGPYGVVTVDRKVKTLPLDALRRIFGSV